MPGQRAEWIVPSAFTGTNVCITQLQARQRQRDHALSSFACTCREYLRAVDTIGRLGGEEFAVLLPAINSDASRIAAEKLRLSIEGKEVKAGAVSFIITVSIDIASWTAGDVSGDLVHAHADHALYAAKKSGRNCPKWVPHATGAAASS